MSIGTKGLLDQREAAKSGVATVTHTAAPEVDLFGEAEGGSLLKARPLGSRAGRPNRRTAAVAALIQHKFGDPLIELARLAMCDPLDLIREITEAQKQVKELLDKDGKPILPMTVREALHFKAECLHAILPYIHAKRAQENDAGETVQPSLTINLGGLDPASLKIAPGGLDAGGFLNLSAALEDGQKRYSAPSEAPNPVESSDDAQHESE